ncbi:hypothetical protein [Petrocella sp. FN5]|uniref:hypothetical protein n=1 Tax=Petrocella sp. FN5 TaxID=3032002 RepID=UPI0023DB1321|nr:hypothetical protein [Petrocella sp. FN5]MDF1616867.1 hypothetical protein [Petrocella sp. FN5]
MTLIVVWTCFLIWYKVRKVKEMGFPNLNILSIVGITILILQMMDTVTIGLPIDVFFKRLIRYLSVIFYGLMIIYLLVKVNRIRKKEYFVDQSTDLKTVFYSMDDLAVIIDHHGVVVELNHPMAYQSIFGNDTHIDEILNRIVKTTKDFDFISIKESLIKEGKKRPIKIILKISEKTFLVTFSSIMSKDTFIGNAMVVYDVTDQKQVEKKLEDQIAYMALANKKLRDSVAITNNLESEKVRLELVDQVQKNLIVKIEKMVTQVHYIQKTHYNTMQEYHKAIHDVADYLREIYKDVRDSIKELFSNQKGVL